MRLLITTAMLIMAVVVFGQDLNGRVYKTTDSSIIFNFIENMIEKDPEMKEEEQKTIQEKEKTKAAKELLYSCLDVSMTIDFKKNHLFVMKADFEVPKTIVFKGKQIEIPWTQRTFLKTAYKPLFFVLNRELGKQRTYNTKSSILYQDEDIKIIMKSGEKDVEINIEGLVIPLSRVK